MGFAIEFIKGAAIPERTSANLEVFTIAADGDRVRRVGLHFYSVSSRFFAGLNQPDRVLKILVVIGGKLGDDIGRLARPDFSLSNCEPGGHRVSAFAGTKSPTSSGRKGIRRPLRRISSARSPSLKIKSRTDAYGQNGGNNCRYCGC